MTTPRYLQGCSVGSQEREEASSQAAWSASARWCVDFNNGNVNNNHIDNNARVRAVRSWSGPAPVGEYQGVVSFEALYRALQCARRNKVASANQLAFEAHWPDRLFTIQEQLNAGTWSPAPTNCFVARRPKAREIHAPDFGDRVVHHWLVPHLEAIYEPRFIFDSHANRVGHGTHAAVDRLRGHVRQVASGQGGGFYLQLDVHNFFNSIHRPTLWSMLKRQMQKSGSPMLYQRVAHALLRHSIQRQGVKHRSSAAERALVPPHKRLENAAPDCGLPIGNLSSQFLANVYLDRLDQFVKHELKARRYVRYVDDFVLVHESRAQLEEWKARIEQFLADELRLSLKDDVRLRPFGAGIDFLGYVVYPTHARVRRRVVSHARAALASWEDKHIKGDCIHATPEAFRQLQSTWASYQGHFKRANAWRLGEGFHRRFGWLASATTRRRFSYRLEGKTVRIKTETTHP
jgi:RNA-directed DNA polymerase